MTFHKSARGRTVNFDELQHKNAHTIAVGSANLNARGDLLGPGGKVIETAESRSAAMGVVTTATSKASVQSEISALKAARSQWAGSTPEPIQNFEPAEPVVEIRKEEQAAEQPESGRKKRTITESE